MERGPRSDRVGFGEKVALGVGTITGFFGFSGPERLAWPVFGLLLKVDPWLIGVSMFIPRVWDALIDPFMGRISDNTAGRFGRRRPYIVIGSAVMAGAFVAMWYVPVGGSDLALMGWFVAAQLVFFTGYTVFSVPYAALTYEMTPDYHERTRVMAFGGFFHKIGETLGGWMPAALPLVTGVVVAGATGIEMEGVHAMGWIVGVSIFLVIGAIPGVFVRERFGGAAGRSARPVRLVEGFRAALTDRSFLVLMAIVTLNTLSGVVGSTVDLFILVSFMHGGDEAMGLTQKAVLGTGYMVVGLAALAPLTAAAERLGKRGAMQLVYVMMIAGALLKWVVFTPGNPVVSVLGLPIDVVMLVDPLLCGPLWVSVKVVIPSMMADICDEDELRCGQRREAVLGATLSCFEKLVMAIAAGMAGWFLSITGYDAELGAAQPEAVFTRMRLLFVAIPGGTALAALLVLRSYRIDAARASATRRELERRRGEAAAPR